MPRRPIPQNIGSIARTRKVSETISHVSPTIQRAKVMKHISTFIAGQVKTRVKRINIRRQFKKNPNVRFAVVRIMKSSVEEVSRGDITKDNLRMLVKELEERKDEFKSVKDLVEFVKTYVRKTTGDEIEAQTTLSAILSRFNIRLSALEVLNNGRVILDPVGGKIFFDQNGSPKEAEIPENAPGRYKLFVSIGLIPRNDPVAYARILDRIAEYNAITVSTTPNEAINEYETAIRDLLANDTMFQKGYKALLEEETNSLFNHAVIGNTIFNTTMQLPAHIVSILSRAMGAILGVMPLARELGMVYGEVGGGIALAGSQIAQQVDYASTMWISPSYAFSQTQSEALNEQLMTSEQAKMAYIAQSQAQAMNTMKMQEMQRSQLDAMRDAPGR